MVITQIAKNIISLDELITTSFNIIIMEGDGFLFYNNYYYCQNRKKGIFIGIALGILFLLLFDSSFNKLLTYHNDEFHGDEDDCDCK